jgi:serine/threonine protein kinase/ligand-binding sensor domain-containing protein
MSTVNRSGLVLLVLLLCGSAKAQTAEIKFEHISLEQGLSQSNVFSIMQDHQGFMWFGTQDGLNKYDGYGFTVFKHKQQDSTSLSDNYINTIYQDSRGIIWVGTAGGGLNRYDPKTGKFTSYHYDPDSPSSISSNYVYNIYEDRSGRLWICTFGGGLNSYDPKTESFTVFRNNPKDPHSISSNRVFSILEDSRGTLWVGTSDGLNSFDPKTNSFNVYKKDTKVQGSISDNSVRVIYEDSSGLLWIGTTNGLNKYNPDSRSFTIFKNDPKDKNSISSDSVLSIRESRSGVLWIGTSDAGLNRFDPRTQSFTAYLHDPRSPNSISGDVIWSIYEDRSGALWVGTFGGGLNRFDPNSQKFTTYRNEPGSQSGLSNNNIWSVYVDKSGVIWLGTFGGGLNSFDPATNSFTLYRNNPKDPNSISNDFIYSIAETEDGILWFATLGGLNRFDRKSGRFIAYDHDPNSADSISSSSVRAVYKDRDGLLWVGTLGGGLNSFDPGTNRFTVYRSDPKSSTSFSGNSVRTIYEDRSGAIWAGTYDGGLNRYDRKSRSFTAYRNDPTDPHSISSNNISAIYEDRTGMLWIGTYGGGLNMYDPGKQTFNSFTQEDGLSSDAIAGILEDNEGYLWISTTKGISKFNPQTKKFKNYDAIDGLQSDEFNMGACFRTESGELFFAGVNGFSRFYPDSMKENPFVPPIAITALKISNRPFDRAIPFISDTAMDLPLVLSYSENMISFEFSALNFTHPQKNSYAYMLEGFDKDWIYSGTRRYAGYTNLDPGEYIFRVKGSNNDGLWNDKGTAIKIRIVPPFWKTWWAYLLYIFSLTWIIYGGHRYRLQVLERRALLLEAKVVERTTEANRKNEELEKKNEELAQKNEEMARKNEELVQSRRRADRIFSALADALPGTVLDGKYHLAQKIGSGGFGAVFRATHLAMKRDVAVKVFKPSPGNDSAEALSRFQAEAISACRVHHPNAVAVFDSGVSAEGIAYLVMELLEGHTVSDELKRRGRLQLRRCVEIIIPVCEVLAVAHANGLIHRDIKPDNIFLHRTGKGELVKLVDFGIAKLLDPAADNQDLTVTGGIIGTPVYMSPERLQSRAYDGRSDVYSLGVVLYEMLCGKAPFQMGEGGLWSVIFSHFNQEPPPLTQINPSIPAAVEKIVLRALSKDPNNRPTAKELAQELATTVDGIAGSPATFHDSTQSQHESSWNTAETVIVTGTRRSGFMLDRKTVERPGGKESTVSDAVRVLKGCPVCNQAFDINLSVCPQDEATLFFSAILDGKYRLDEKIGNGGMGDVYKATNIETNEKWAVKILHPDLVESEASSVDRFLNEVRIMSQIDHPNIVKAVDFNFAKGAVYLAMELLEGNNLKSEIVRLAGENKRLSYEDISLILTKTCLAADATHKQNIIHRDLKTENIFLIKNGEGKITTVKVIDFGIAIIKGSRFTKTKHLIGTPEYMSPEHCDSKELDCRSDIYSLGIDLYEMLTGRVPFPINFYDPHEIIYKHIFERPKPLRQLCPDIPEKVEMVVMRALEKRPEYRQQSALDLAGEFREALLENGIE